LFPEDFDLFFNAFDGGFMFPISDPVLVFTVLILTMLVAPLVAERLRLPDLVLLLLAGVMLGSKGFGILPNDSSVKLFGSVGLLYIMFLAGLEIDLHRFVRTGLKSGVFGIFTFAIPQGIGMIIGRYVLGFDWVCSVLLASMFASRTLLSYPIASRLGISRKEPVAITVGATIVTDTLALLVLAVIADNARGVELGLYFWLGVGAGMCALILIIWYGIPRLARWFFGNVTEEGGAQFLFVLVLLCACSYVSHFAKLEPIIGAFLAGAAFNRLIPENSVLMNRVTFAGKTIFIPFFLLSVGMLVDPMAILFDPRSWFVSIVMVVVVVGTKFAAAWLAGAVFGYNPDARKVMFGLSVVQAAATLAAVLIGYELKIFDESVLNGAIAMIAVTCPLGAWAVEKYGRRLAEETIQRKEGPTVEQRMLVLLSNPNSATKILDLAFCIRDTSKPGIINPINVIRNDDNVDESVMRGEKLLSECMAHANSAGMSIIPSVRIASNISDGITRSAKELRSNLLLLGWIGAQGAQSKIFGSLFENLIELCPTRIIFCRLVKPINTTLRLLVLFPPMAERHPSLNQLLADIKFLSKQIGAEIRVYTASKEIGNLRSMIETARPSRPVTFVENESMFDARRRLFSDVGSHDMIFMIAERRSSVLWAPTIDKTSEAVAEKFNDNNMLLEYPPLVIGDDEVIGEEVSIPPRMEFRSFDIGCVYGLDAAINKMVVDGGGICESAIEEAKELLLLSGRSYPIQLSQEAVLLHAHCQDIECPLMIVASSSKAFELPGAKSRARIIIALLNPRGAPSEQHLKSLAKLGRLFLDKNVVDSIHQAVTAEGIRKIIEKNFV